jgi:hypothetical protein
MCGTVQSAVLCRAVAGVVMAKLGADVTVTDLAPNLPLLQHNCSANGTLDHPNSENAILLCSAWHALYCSAAMACQTPQRPQICIAAAAQIVLWECYKHCIASTDATTP